MITCFICWIGIAHRTKHFFVYYVIPHNVTLDYQIAMVRRRRLTMFYSATFIRIILKLCVNMSFGILKRMYCLLFQSFEFKFFYDFFSISLTLEYMGPEISKRYSSDSSCPINSKLFLQQPWVDPHNLLLRI